MIRLALRVRREDAEVALAELLALAPGGVEEVDRGDEVEFAVYGPPGELPELPDLEAAAGGAFVAVTTTEVADDWADRWRRFHRPVTVGRVHVRPPWEPPPEAGLVDLVVDPGRAFGTGAHPTTRLCLALLQGMPADGSLLDLGAGSGVLALAAARLGFAPVLAADHDVLAVEATAANAAANGVGLAAVERLDLRTEPVPATDVLVANILRPVLLLLADRLPDPRPRALVLGGLLDHEADGVAAAFAPHGYEEAAREEADGWAALRLVRFVSTAARA